MKSIKEWLETLPDIYSKRALFYHSNYHGKGSADCLENALVLAFKWSSTAEGTQYWRDLHNKVCIGENLIPKPPKQKLEVKPKEKKKQAEPRIKSLRIKKQKPVKFKALKTPKKKILKIKPIKPPKTKPLKKGKRKVVEEIMPTQHIVYIPQSKTEKQDIQPKIEKPVVYVECNDNRFSLSARIKSHKS